MSGPALPSMKSLSNSASWESPHLHLTKVSKEQKAPYKKRSSSTALGKAAFSSKDPLMAQQPSQAADPPLPLSSQRALGSLTGPLHDPLHSSWGPSKCLGLVKAQQVLVLCSEVAGTRVKEGKWEEARRVHTTAIISECLPCPQDCLVMAIPIEHNKCF